jgi:hypothetical protein
MERRRAGSQYPLLLRVRVEHGGIGRIGSVCLINRWSSIAIADGDR